MNAVPQWSKATIGVEDEPQNQSRQGIRFSAQVSPGGRQRCGEGGDPGQPSGRSHGVAVRLQHGWEHHKQHIVILQLHWHYNRDVYMSTYTRKFPFFPPFNTNPLQNHGFTHCLIQTRALSSARRGELNVISESVTVAFLNIKHLGSFIGAKYSRNSLLRSRKSLL